jgi:hypothetical protein
MLILAGIPNELAIFYEIAAESFMFKTLDNQRTKMQISVVDAFLYVIAGSAMSIISVSFLLWLRF